MRERVHDLGHRLDEQRLSIDQFLQATGRTGDDLVAEIREEARRSVKADLALRALAEAEEIEVTDDEFDDRARGDGRPDGDHAGPGQRAARPQAGRTPRYARSSAKPRR